MADWFPGKAGPINPADSAMTPVSASLNVAQLDLARSGLSGAGTVSPANDLDFKMSATVHTSGLLAVVGNTPIPFTVQGTCAESVFRPGLKAVAREKVKSMEGGLEKAGGGLMKGMLGGKKN